ncbi:Rrf2 family transcriptional regulator [Paenibacillus flagellatus]|uniref:Rrf2 family transcriptional regulator n=1 Tax=Paenibacillus flagellatus TaxID=2211139 RepID=A0A2V5K3T7_9BACL|nr:Rrf2 family transcriptional regulator [Paenibacillus flagellatus]PYI52524.1 Rrf2 family transcriptional regulator [Paenibacillus flagellatus]
MNNSLSIEYALHSVVNLAAIPPEVTVTIKQLAHLMGIAHAYLAKVFTQLAKAGIVRSTVGSKGGISLARPADDITFYDVFVAVNGRGQLYQCANIRAFSLGYVPMPGMCEIHQTMREAEERMFDHLRKVKISTMADLLLAKLPQGSAEERVELIRGMLGGAPGRRVEPPKPQ